MDGIARQVQLLEAIANYLRRWKRRRARRDRNRQSAAQHYRAWWRVESPW